LVASVTEIVFVRLPLSRPSPEPPFPFLGSILRIKMRGLFYGISIPSASIEANVTSLHLELGDITFTSNVWVDISL